MSSGRRREAWPPLGPWAAPAAAPACAAPAAFGHCLTDMLHVGFKTFFGFTDLFYITLF